MILKDVKKKHTSDLDKLFSPEETFHQFNDKLKTLSLDILDRVERIDNGRLGIPVYFSYTGKDALQAIGNKKQMGKGATVAQAKASAVMELAERFSLFCFKQNEDHFIQKTAKEFDAPKLPFDLIAASVHDTGKELDQAKDIFDTISFNWCRAHNLTHQSDLWIPFDWFYAINEFNGGAAGNCVEEALIQGICEIVERDVSARVNAGKLSVPQIDLATVTDPVVKALLEKYHAQGIQVFVSDFTLDTGIPTVGVLAYDPSTFPHKSEIVWTAGTTPHPEKAFNRALTEVAQLAGDFNTGSNYVASGLPKFKSIAEAEFITQAQQIVSIQDLPNVSHISFKTEIENCLAALSAKGLEVIVVDVTHPQLGIPAFYTIVPGTQFRETAKGKSVLMFCAKHITENTHPLLAYERLKMIDRQIPGKYYIQFYQGQSRLSLGDPESALPYFEKALQMEPVSQDIPSIYSYMGVSLKEMDQYEKALDVLEKGRELDEDRTDIHNLMGFCYFKLKEHQKAIQCFKEVLRLNPSSGIDYANIASNYRDMGEIKKAVAYYETALEIDSTLDFARENLEKLRKQLGVI